MKKKIILISIISALVVAITMTSLALAGVFDKKKTEFSIDKERIVFSVLGESETITPSETDGVVWSSSNSAIVSVNDGVVTSVSNGIAEISASRNGQTVYCVVVVEYEAVITPGISINFDKTVMEIALEYETQKTIFATVEKDGEPYQTQITWSSLNENVATVEDGVVTAKAKGAAVIKAQVDNGEEYAQAFCAVNVVDDVDILATEKTDYYTTDVIDLGIKVMLNGQQINNSAVMLRSSDISVATVENGKIYPKKAGTVDIFAVYDNVERRFSLNITEKHFISTAQEFLDMDGKGENIVYELKANIDLTQTPLQTYEDKAVFVKTFNGLLDGKGYTVKFSYTPAGQKMRGLFGTISMNAKVENLIIRGNVTLDGDYQNGVVGSMLGTIENCYIDVVQRQTASSSGNWLITTPIFGGLSGTIKNTIIKTAGYAGSNPVTRLSLGTAVTGKFDNVAFVSPTEKPDIGWGTGVYNSKIKGSVFQGFYAYTDLLDITTTNGYMIKNDNDDNVYEYLEFTEKQTFGSAWAFSANDITLCGSSIVFEIVEITTAKQLKEIPLGNGGIIYRLKNDIVMTGETLANITNSSSYVYIETFNDILDGNGHKITYEVTPDDGQKFAGLIYNVGANATIKNLRIDAVVNGKGDNVYAFCYKNMGTIENCYIKAQMVHDGNSGGNYTATYSFMWEQSGLISNCIFNGTSSITGGNKGGLSISRRSYGTYNTVAYTSPSNSAPTYKNNLWSGYLSTQELSEIRLYTGLDEIKNGGNGKTITSTGSAYQYNGATDKQTFGGAWTISANGILLLDKNVES